MRRSEKEIKDKTVIIDVLNRCHIGRLGTIGKGGYPMVKPLNFTYNEGKIYFHTATEGEKIDDIKRESRVCRELDLSGGDLNVCPKRGEAAGGRRSVIIKGR